MAQKKKAKKEPLDPLRTVSTLTATACALAFGVAVDQLGWVWALGIMFATIMALGARNLYLEWPLGKSPVPR